MRYIIVDDHGTNQQCWTRATALEWLAKCKGRAAIFCGFTMRRLVTRQSTPCWNFVGNESRLRPRNRPLKLQKAA